MSIRPVRLQLSRRPGFRLEEISRAANGLEAVNVARPSKWGNPFDFRKSDYCWIALSYGCRGDGPGRREASVLAFREWITPIPGKRLMGMERGMSFGNDEKSIPIGPVAKAGPPPTIECIAAELRGKNLACWCPLPARGEPDICHAAVLLELANPGPGNEER